MSNVFRNYIFIYRNNHKCNIGTVQNTKKKRKLKKLIKLNND